MAGNDIEERGRARKREALNKCHAKCLGIYPAGDEGH